MTPGLSLARGFSFSTQNLAWTPILKLDLTSAIGIMHMVRGDDHYLQAQTKENGGREDENAGQGSATRDVK